MGWSLSRISVLNAASSLFACDQIKLDAMAGFITGESGKIQTLGFDSVSANNQNSCKLCPQVFPVADSELSDVRQL